jgi:hypothetical protein
VTRGWKLFSIFLALVLFSSFVLGDVYITEIMYNPSTAQGDDSDLEWVELFNNATSPIDLSNYQINSNDFDDFIIGSGEYAVISSELTDGVDTDTDSFATVYGNTDGVWNHLVDNFNASNGILNLVNSENEVVLNNGLADIDKLNYTIAFGNNNGFTVERFNINTQFFGESKTSGGSPGAQNSIFDNTDPTFTNTTLTNATTGDLFEVIVTPSDNVAIFNITFFNGTDSTFMENVSNVFKYNITIFQNSVSNFIYNFTVLDTAGNYQKSREYLVTISDNDPATFTNSTPTNATTDDLFEVIVTPTDNIAVSNVIIFNGTVEEEMDNVSGVFFYNITIPKESVSEITYNFTVFDTKGNPNGSKEFKTTVSDNDPATFTNTTPTNATTDDLFEVIVTPTDNIAVSNIIIFNGTTQAEMDNVSGVFFYNITIPKNSIADITYNFTVFDTKGNPNGSKEFKTTVSDNDTPTFTNSTPTNLTTGQSLTIQVTPSDNVAVDRVRINVNGTESLMTNNLGTYEKTITVESNHLAVFNYNFTVYDSSNNKNISKVYKVTVTDNDAPTIDTFSVNATLLNPFTTFMVNGTTSDNILVNSVNLNKSSATLSLPNFTIITNPSTAGCGLNETCTLTITSNDSASNSASQTITLTVDNQAPSISNPTLTSNSFNFITPNSDYLASVTANDANGIKNMSCTVNSVTTFYNVSHSGLTCTLTSPAVEAVYNVTFNVTDNAGNTAVIATNFTNIAPTQAKLELDNITIKALADEFVEFNISANLTNTGSGKINSPKIFFSDQSTFRGVDISTISPLSQDCNNLESGDKCTKTFAVTLRPHLAPQDYTLQFDANWTSSSGTEKSLTFISESKITVNSYPNISTQPNITATATRGQNLTVTLRVNASGNLDLSPVDASYTAGTLETSKVSISPISVSKIKFGENTTFNVTFEIPLESKAGNFTGTINFASSSLALAVPLKIEVPASKDKWNLIRDNTIRVSRSDASGGLSIITINNSDNIGQKFTFNYNGSLHKFLFDTSSPTSANLAAFEVKNFTVKHKSGALQSSYDLTVNITTNASLEERQLQLNLSIDDQPPAITVTAPSNLSYVTDTIVISTTVIDSFIEKTELLIEGVSVNSSVISPYDLYWNTTIFSEGPTNVTIKAFDKAGNLNSTIIVLNVNNSNDFPYLIKPFPTLSFPEDTTNSSLNFTDHFGSFDGETLNYSVLENSSKLNFSIDQSTGIVTFNPEENYSGTENLVYAASDPSGLEVKATGVVVIESVNDAPSTPTLISPVDGSTKIQASGSLDLNWTDSEDVDSTSLQYYLYFSNNTTPKFHSIVSNSFVTLTSLNNNTKYYWKVSAFDGNLYSDNSSTFSVTLISDTSPVINFSTPTSPVTLSENSSLIFNVTAHDLDGDSITYKWFLDGNLVSSQNIFNYYTGFNDAGNHVITAEASDSNRNMVTQTFAVIVTNLNRIPYLEIASNQTMSENSNINFSVSANDLDNSTLTFSLDSSDLQLTKRNNTHYDINWTAGDLNVGEKVFKLTVSDGEASINKELMITVKEVNDAPNLTLSNVTVVEGSVVDFTIGATDLDNNTLTITKDQLRGDLNSSSGRYNYTTKSTDVGNYTITFTVSDGNLSSSAPMNVFVQNQNDIPELNTIPDLVVNQDELLTFTVTASDKDLGFNQNEHLVFSVNDVNASIINLTQTTAQVNFTGDNSRQGIPIIRVTVTDRAGSSVFQDVNIKVNNVNDAPIITHADVISIDEGRLLDVVISAIDPDNDTLLYTKDLSRGTLDTNTGRFQFTPDPNEIGIITFKFTVTDNNSVSTTKEINISVNDANNIPEILSFDAPLALEDNLSSFKIVTRDHDALDTLNYKTNDSSRYSLISSSNTSAVFSWTPVNEDVPLTSVIVTVTDPSGAESSQTINLSVQNTNDAPSIISLKPEDAIIGEDKSITLRVNATDPDKDSLEYHWSVNGSNQTVKTSDFLFLARTDLVGDVPIHVEAIDPSGARDSKIVTVKVSDKPVSTKYTGTFTQIDPSNTTTLKGLTIINEGKGKIDYLGESINLDDVVDVDNNVFIEDNFISVNSTAFSVLNKPALLTLFAPGTKNPKILTSNKTALSKNEVNDLCTDCQVVSFSAGNGETKFNVTGFSAFTVVDSDSLFGLSLPSKLDVSGDRNTNATSSFVIANNGRLPITNIQLKLTIFQNFSIQISKDNINFGTSLPLFNLAPGDQQTIFLKATVPQTVPVFTVANLEYSSVEVGNRTLPITVKLPSKLSINRVDLDIDGRDRVVSPGVVYEVEPGDSFDVDIEFKNLYTFQQDIDIEDIDVDIEIKRIDDGDELDDEEEISVLRAEDTKDVDFDFIIPLEADEGKYTVSIKAVGRDLRGQSHSANLDFQIDVEKQLHDVRILKAELLPRTVDCNRQSSLDLEVKNIGRDDEDDVAVEVTSSALGLNFYEDNIDLSNDGFDSDSSYEKILVIRTTKETQAGDYPVSIKVFRRSSRIEDSRTLNLQVAECIQQQLPVVSSKKPSISLKPLVEVNPPVTKESRKISEFEEMFLLLLILFMLGGIIFLIGAAVILTQKGRRY